MKATRPYNNKVSLVCPVTVYKKIAPLLLLTVLIAFPLFVQNTPFAYYIRAMGVVGLYVILALGLNVTLGYVGLFDLGYIAFYAVGAYTAAILSTHGWSFPLILPVAIGLAMLIRLFEGIPILRLRGDYLAIVTMGFGEITRLALNNLDPLTNGPKGLPRVGETIAPISFFGVWENIHYYYLILGSVLLCCFISKRLENSRIGRAWVAIREDEIAAELTGLPVARLKLLAFTMSSVYAALAGVIFAHWERFVTPESFVFWESILVVSMIVLGGIGSIPGAILGAVILQGAPQLLQVFLGDWISYRYLLFGVILVLMVLFRPQGIWPKQRTPDISAEHG